MFLAYTLAATGVVGAQTPFTSVQQVRALTPDQAKQPHSVVLRGHVMTLSGWKSSFFFDDGTGGISVDRMTPLPGTSQGDEVEIHGHSAPGLFAPIVVADTVRVEAHGKLPEPHVYAATALSGGAKDSQWIGLRGIVRTAEVKDLWGQPRLLLSVDIGAGTLVSVVVHDFDPALAGTLPSASVLLRGVCGTIFNGRRQFIGLRLFVANMKDITIETPAPSEPFNLPERSLTGILQFRDGNERIGLVKVFGTVTWSKPGTGLYIQDGDESLFVQSGQQQIVPVGTHIQAVGYPALGTYAPQLENSIFRVTASGPAVQPADVPASAMITNKDGFTAVPYDSTLVRMRGKLLEHFVRGDEGVLLLQDGATVYSARMTPEALRAGGFDDGSLLELTGVCSITADRLHEPRTFALLMRSAADVVVLKSAPWWTARHALWAVLFLVLMALVLAGVIAFLRHEAKLRGFAIADPLTGLYNRRGFLAYAQSQWSAAQKQDAALLLFYIDLDHFKQINDTFGHEQGDCALLQVAGLLREGFRKSDIVGRLGGDEFAIVAMNSTESTRVVLEERLHQAVAQVNERARLPFKIELSVGVIACRSSSASSEQETIEDLLARADKAMYEQKRSRRKQRVSAPAFELQAAQ